MSVWMDGWMDEDEIISEKAHLGIMNPESHSVMSQLMMIKSI